jgi:fructose-bisphosphate aldolase class II
MLLNMKDLLSVANEQKFAVPAFNVGVGVIVKSVVECAEEKQAPVIIAIHPNELEYATDSFVEQCKALAHASRVPMTIHLDHGSTVGHIMRAIRTGFTSVMIDASHSSFEDNIAITKKVVELAHPLGVSVEGELGTIGTASKSFEGGADEIVFTKPEDAERFVAETGVDSLAIAIGTAHGLYPKGFVPKLRLDLLGEIKRKVTAPLVLHGGSANPDSEIAESVKRGVNKINISSDMKDAFFRQLTKDLAADPKVLEPMDALIGAVEAAKAVIRHKIDLFNDADKVKYYKL